MKNKVHLCDNMEFMANIPDNYYELAIVDPPYGLGDSVVNSGGRFKRYQNKNGNWDTKPPTKEYFNELFRISNNQIIWGGNYFIDKLKPSKCFLIWDKMQPQGVSFASSELAWTSFDKVVKTFYKRTQCQEGRFHPTQKPVALYKWLLQNYANKGDKIFDSHVGSGSSRIACYDLGYDFEGCEIDKDYWQAQEDRYNKHISIPQLFGPNGIEKKEENKLKSLF